MNKIKRSELLTAAMWQIQHIHDGRWLNAIRELCAGLDNSERKALSAAKARAIAFQNENEIRIGRGCAQSVASRWAPTEVLLGLGCTFNGCGFTFGNDLVDFVTWPSGESYSRSPVSTSGTKIRLGRERNESAVHVANLSHALDSSLRANSEATATIKELRTESDAFQKAVADSLGVPGASHLDVILLRARDLLAAFNRPSSHDWLAGFHAANVPAQERERKAADVNAAIVSANVKAQQESKDTISKLTGDIIALKNRCDEAERDCDWARKLAHTPISKEAAYIAELASAAQLLGLVGDITTTFGEVTNCIHRLKERTTDESALAKASIVKLEAIIRDFRNAADKAGVR